MYAQDKELIGREKEMLFIPRLIGSFLEQQKSRSLKSHHPASNTAN